MSEMTDHPAEPRQGMLTAEEHTIGRWYFMDENGAPWPVDGCPKCRTKGPCRITTQQARITSLETALAEAREILLAMVDPEPCRLDHHGACQAHNLSTNCPHGRAKDLLGLPEKMR